MYHWPFPANVYESKELEPMNSEKFEIQNSLEASYLSVELTEPYQLDKIGMRVLMEDWPEFLIPYQLKRINHKVCLRYRLMNAAALEYSSRTLPKSAFIKMFKSLLEPFLNGRDWFLDYHNLCVDTRYVYLDRRGDKAYFIYVPEKSFQNTDEEILAFFKKVFAESTITDDKDFQVRLYQYFAGDTINLSGLNQLLLSENRTPFKNPVRYAEVKQEANNPPGAALKSEEPEEVQKADPDSDEKIMEVLFGDNKKSKRKEKPKKEKKIKEKRGKEKPQARGGLFRKKKEPAQAASEELGGTAAISLEALSMKKTGRAEEYFGTDTECYGEETEILSDSQMNGSSFLELVYSELMGAPERIELNFPGRFQIIGRSSNDEARPDVAFPGDFKRIGRRHARIEKNERGYCIIDLGSVNHTFLNGQRMIPNQPYPLSNGMEVQFTESKPVRYRVHVQENF